MVAKFEMLVLQRDKRKLLLSSSEGHMLYKDNIICLWRRYGRKYWAKRLNLIYVIQLDPLPQLYKSKHIAVQFRCANFTSSVDLSGSDTGLWSSGNLFDIMRLFFRSWSPSSRGKS